MALSFSGRPPVVAVPSPNSPQIDQVTPNAEVIKGVLAARLEATKGQLSASEQVSESEVHLIGDELLIKTSLSRTMLPVVINAEAERLMQATLAEYGLSGIRIKLLSAASANAKGIRDKTASAVAVDASFKRLSNSAARLNEISDKLSKQVEQIDAALKRLNLGVTAWVTVKTEDDEEGNSYEELVGYTKFGNRWAVALKVCSDMRGGNPNEPEELIWAFADGPRQIRIRAVQYIPALLEALCAEADKMIEQLAPRVEDLAKVTNALGSTEGGR